MTRLIAGACAFAVCLAVAPPAARAAPPAMTVWAIGDHYRINPMTNRAYEDNRLLYSDCRSEERRVGKEC